MRNFYRALKGAAKYWRSIFVATACSFAVAALWGANIGTFYPILEVTINGKSMHTWVDEEVARYKSQLQTEQTQLEDLRALVDTSPAVIDAKRQQVQDSQSRLDRSIKLEWWVKKFVPNDPFQTISLLVGLLIVSTLAKHVFLIASEVLVGRVALDLSRTIRMEVYDKALHMDRQGYSGFGTSCFTSSITHTSDMLSTGMMSTLGAALREPLKMISCLLGAGFICWRLLLFSVAIAPVVGVFLYFVTHRLRSIARGQLAKAQNYHAVMLEGLGNINTVQSFVMEQHESDRFGEATKAVRDFGLRFVFYTSLSKPIIEFLGLGMLATTIVGGAYLVLKQETHLLGIPICAEPLGVSALLVFFGMLVGVSDPLRKMSAVYSSIYAGCMAADGLYSILDRDNLIVSSPNPAEVAVPHSNLRVENITFGYQPEQPALQSVSLEIPFGSTIAIVGANGSGKSTLIHLLNRFYDPWEGAIFLDDHNIRDLRLEDLRRRIGLVNQHTELFNETVAFNIRYGRPDASMEEVVRAARCAEADEFIVNTLDAGYETKIGENGNRLSGGQRQRLALARALLCDPEILILDESTSQIDMASEQAIRNSLMANRGARTVIIITHREKLLEIADSVYELQQGRLVEHVGRAAA